MAGPTAIASIEDGLSGPQAQERALPPPSRLGLARTFSFGPFLLVPERQLLLQGETPVKIGCRALDLLTALVERPGELVSKKELMARIWPTTTVEEGNLKVNMAALRRALGEDAISARYIATVTGRGYRFIAPVQTDRHLAHPWPLVPEIGPSPRPSLLQEAHRQVESASTANRASAQGSPVEAVGCGIIVDGEITLLIENAAISLTSGSLVVRLGSGEACANPSARTCRLLLVHLVAQDDTLVGAERAAFAHEPLTRACSQAHPVDDN
jgi:DNA-binding winged helix-turn-helix (wHTH) protein